ncbi:hypothetical protein ACLESD_25285 [Pyxidicoccus sp. 3LFB2]
MMTAVLATALAGTGAVLWLLFWKKSPHPERCDRCDGPRVRLDETSEDPHLTEAQRHEEQRGAADYDVWWCGACERGMVVRHALLSTTRRVSCEKCGKGTVNEVARTLSPATQAQGGEFLIQLSCEGCGHQQKFWRYTPRLSAR